MPTPIPAACRQAASGRCWPSRFAAALISLIATMPAEAAVSYTYTGRPLVCAVPGPLSGACFNYGPNVFGGASFDDTLVTPDFTGTATALTVFLGTAGLGSSTSAFNAAQGPFVFAAGAIVGWSLNFQFSTPVRPGSLIPILSSAAGESISPVTGGLVLGVAAAGGPGTWVREGLPAPVPLPAALPLLGAGLAAFGALARRRRSG